jgi:hypothetical protein
MDLTDPMLREAARKAMDKWRHMKQQQTLDEAKLFDPVQAREKFQHMHAEWMTRTSREGNADGEQV